MSEFGPEILTKDLRPEDVPYVDPESDEAWMAFTRFAFTYDGYERCRNVGAVANGAVARYREDGALPEDPEEIRACLFFEQRRWRHFGVPPDAETWRYLNALLDELRKCLT